MMDNGKWDNLEGAMLRSQIAAEMMNEKLDKPFDLDNGNPDSLPLVTPTVGFRGRDILANHRPYLAKRYSDGKVMWIDKPMEEPHGTVSLPFSKWPSSSITNLINHLEMI